MVAIVVVDSACEVLTVRLGELGLLVQETEYSAGSGLYQINAVLVVHKAHTLHPQPLLLVQLLLVLEDPLVEELLEFLIAVVDTKLLKAVYCKVFKARDIKNSNVVSRGLEWNTLVDPLRSDLF